MATETTPVVGSGQSSYTATTRYPNIGLMLQASAMLTDDGQAAMSFFLLQDHHKIVGL